jgi:hypothetical protein
MFHANSGVPKNAIFIIYLLNDIFFTFSPIYERNTTNTAIIIKTIIFHVLSRKSAVTPKNKLKENTRVSI